MKKGGWFLIVFLLINISLVLAESPNLINGNRNLPSLDDADISNKTFNINITQNINQTITGNPFDQSLNTTDDVLFNSVNVTTWFRGLFNWTTISRFLSFDGATLTLDDTLLNVTINESIDLRTASTTYNASAIETVEGTLDDGFLNSTFFAEDDNVYNVSEDAGGSPILILINFTGVIDFNTIIIRELYEGGSGHEIDICLWHYGNNDWDCHDDITDMVNFAYTNLPIPDPANHLSGNIVQMKFDHDQSGNPAHNFFLDYVVLIDGFTSITTSQHNALSGRDSCPSNHPDGMCNDGDNVTGDYTFDFPTFHIDSTNDKIGVGTISPDTLFHIKGTPGSTAREDADFPLFKIKSTTNISGLSLVDDSVLEEGYVIFLDKDDDRLHMGFMVETAAFVDTLNLLSNGSVQALKDFTVDAAHNVFHVDSTNNRVGIGTTTPGSLLTVYGDLNITNNGNIWWDYAEEFGVPGFTRTNLLTVNFTDSRDTLFIGIPGNTALPRYVFMDGNVGIGTTSPTTFLHVNGTADPNVIIEETGSSKASILSLKNAQTDWWVFSDANPDIFGIRDHTAGTQPFQIEESAPTNSLYIQDDGNVGIGIGTPDVPLDVQGTGQENDVIARFYDTARGFETFGLNIRNPSDANVEFWWNTGNHGGLKIINEGAGTTDLWVEDGIFSYGVGFLGDANTEYMKMEHQDTFADIYIDETGSGIVRTFAINHAGTRNALFQANGKVLFPNIGTTGENDNACFTSAGQLTREVDGTCDASSLSVKNNVYNLTYGIDDVMKLRPIFFKYNTEIKPTFQLTRLGFVAEEMELVIPEVVTYSSYTKDGFINGSVEGIDYAKFTAVLTKAIQELKQENDLLNSSTQNLALQIQEIQIETCKKDITWSWC